MPLSSLLVCALLVVQAPASPPAQPPPQSASALLRWVRGTVLTETPTSVSLGLENRSLTLAVDSSTLVIGPGGRSGPSLAAGSLVEAHYVESKGGGRARVVIAGMAGGAVSKRPGWSYLGVVSKRGGHDIEIRVGRKTHKVDVESRTRLVDRHGVQLAEGRRPVLAMVRVGDTLLVKYEESDDSMVVNDITVPGTRRTATEIRTLADDGLRF